MAPYERNAGSVADYRQQSRVFLAKSREYLADGDLHQASEKGWGAASWMAKAVAEAQGWSYSRHDEFLTVMYQAADLSGDTRLRNLRRVANELRGFFYTRKMLLRPGVILEGLDDIETMLNILQPLTEPDSAVADQ
jgi:hypothetical protein